MRTLILSLVRAAAPCLLHPIAQEAFACLQLRSFVLLKPRRELDHIPDAQVNGLHSYRVNDAPGLSILVEGGNAAGERFASDQVALS